jgi:EAL domain-containing protein (putative c-di-GMP-specific phosphodiesterase class I)
MTIPSPPVTIRTPMPVDTKSVPDRRTLRFETIDQALAEADRLADADRAGRLKPLGNWALGQTLGHLATWADYSYTGTPLNPRGSSSS